MSQKAYNTNMSAHTVVNSFAEFVIDICQQTVCLLKQQNPQQSIHAQNQHHVCVVKVTQRNMLDHKKCVGNSLVQQIEADNPQVKKYIVCDKCFKKIQN